jgi:hypothetical protein
MATIWPYRREECTDIPKLVFNPQTKVDFDGENRAIITDQDPNLTEFSLSVPLMKKVSNYFGKKSKDIKIDYCLVLTNKETRSRMMQKMNLQGSLITTQKNIKTNHLRGKIELNLYAVLAEDVPFLTDTDDSPANKGTILATWPQLLIYLDPPPVREGDEVDTEWVAFSEMDPTKKFPKAIHFVDLDETKVIINDDLPVEIKNILQGNEGGAIKALRDAYFTPVAVDITEQLVRNALMIAKKSGGLENLEEDYSRITKSICTHLTGIDDPHEAWDELDIILNDEGKFNDIIGTVLPLACQHYHDVSRKLNNHALHQESNR